MRLGIIVAATGLTACSPAIGTGEKAQIANPASEYCVSLGGRLEIRNEAGGQVGYCHLPDGTVVEEWELFRAARADRS